jgi:uncharacterized membrane protein YhfC
MISFTLFLSLFIAGLLEIFVPVLLSLWLVSKISAKWGVFFIGAAMWFIAFLVRTPINSSASLWVYNNFSGALYIYLSIAVPSLTAGVFEEGARWFAFRFLAKDHRLENGLMYGVGHGGIESILLVGISVLSTAITAYFYPLTFTAAQLDAIAATPAWLAFVGLWERLAAISFHIGMSVLVLESFRQKQPFYVGAAMAAHFFFNFSAIYASQWGVIASELVSTAWGIVALWYVWTTWKSNQVTLSPPLKAQSPDTSAPPTPV